MSFITISKVISDYGQDYSKYYHLFGTFIPLLIIKTKTIKNSKQIKKYYLFGFIPYFTIENTSFYRRKFLFNIPIRNRKYKVNYAKNNIDISVIETKKHYNINNYSIDIVIPVYNGYQFLNNLFMSIINNTDVPYKIFCVNDCSSDEKVLPLLEDWVKKFETKMVLINNQANLGFIKSVNVALEKTTNHVVLLNTDVILPKNWAKRLFYPIVTDEKVGSVTPFSNAATIFSIPKIGDNDFNGGIEKVNNSLQVINTPYNNIKLPTGVGFCMAMSRSAIDEVGFFDEVFGKGYGEENDWCQRVIKKGYINTIAGDLFVWHLHGGSFISEEKKKLIEKNSQIIKKRYPKYNKSVANIYKDNTFMSIRFIAEMLYFSTLTDNCEVWFNHSMGGGAEQYSKRIIDELKSNTLIIKIQNNTIMTYIYKDYINSIQINDFSEIILILQVIKVEKIVVNNIASYFDPINTLEKISDLKKILKVPLEFKGHDLFAVCPIVTMCNYKGVYCNAKNRNECDECLNYLEKSICMKIDVWHNTWNNFFLEIVDNIELFSKSSADIFTKFYPKIENKITVIPHIVPELRKVNVKKHKGINIGVLGHIAEHKGLNILKKINSIINNKKYRDVNIIIIGKTSNRFKNIKLLGKYNIETLPTLIEDNNIDIIFIPSIVPETFSYTTSEAMLMGLRVACFNLGAQAEKVKNYELGLIIDKVDGKYALEQIISFVSKEKQ